MTAIAPARSEAREAELALVQRAADGDVVARRELARLVLERVRRIARALCRSASDADDAAQQSLLEILRCARSFRGDSPLEHWASRIAARTSLRMSMGEQRRRTVSVDELGEIGDGHTPSLGLPRDIRAYLDRISDVQRQAIVLHHALGHSIEEIAEMTGVSPNTVKSRMRLGMATLREGVRADEGGRDVP